LTRTRAALRSRHPACRGASSGGVLEMEQDAVPPRSVSQTGRRGGPGAPPWGYYGPCARSFASGVPCQDSCGWAARRPDEGNWRQAFARDTPARLRKRGPGLDKCRRGAPKGVASPPRDAAVRKDPPRTNQAPIGAPPPSDLRGTFSKPRGARTPPASRHCAVGHSHPRTARASAVHTSKRVHLSGSRRSCGRKRPL
jgi:hypothetical protein